MGELTIARERFEQSLALYRPEMHDSQIAQYGTDLGVAGHCYHALTLWHLGYPDQAVEESYRSITLAQDGAHPFSQAYALFVSAWVHHLRRDVSATQTQAEAAIRLATEQELPSLYENNDYLINCSLMEVLASVYDPEHTNATNPLCWPYWATREDLQGLPPHVISVNELDPLRDEGLQYYQKLLAAGVRVYSRTVNGTCHAGDVLFRKAIPDVYAATIRDIKGFADSL